MTFPQIIIRSLLRRPVRTGLTLLGISVGIGAVVALVGMSHGFEKSWTDASKSMGSDMVISTMGSTLMPTPFSDSVRGRISHLPHIANTCTSLVEAMGVENASMMIVSGREWNGFTWKHLKLLAGRMPMNDTESAVVLGELAADVLKKKIGDPIMIENENLTVVGIVQGDVVVENGAVILSLPLFQKISGNSGKINIIDVSVTPSSSDDDVKQLLGQINVLVPEARAMLAGENMGKSQMFSFIRATSWGTSLLAVTVGAFGVMNTMLMSVFERTQEICILLALGWKRTRIIRMILWESALLGLLGGALGLLIGTIAVKAIATAPAIHGMLEPDLSVGLMINSMLLSIGVGVISGLYPAWYGSRLAPSVAIHGS